MKGRVGACALVTAVMVLGAIGLGAAEAGAACPNEAFRVGPSSQLGECRAYEMVSPVDKEGGAGVSQGGYVQAATSGEGVSFTSSSAYAGSEGSTLYNHYLATRAGGAWGTHNIDGPQETQEGLFIRPTFALSPDLGQSVTVSRRAFAPGAIEGGSNLYLRNTVTGASTLMAAVPDAYTFAKWVGFNENGPFVDASDDWSTILLAGYGQESPLTPDAAPKRPNVYEFRGGRLSLAAPPGASSIAGASTSVDPNAMSADGHRFFYYENEEYELFEEPAFRKVLYLHQDGAAPTPISVSERTGEEGTPAEEVNFVGADPTGSVVFFSTATPMTDDALESPSLYRYEVAAPAGKRLTDISPTTVKGPSRFPEVQTVIGFQDAGEFVYFTAKGNLVPGVPKRPEGAGANIYVWHGEPGTPGVVRYVGQTTLEQEPAGPQPGSVSASGRYLGFQAYGEVTPEAIEGSEESCPLNQGAGNIPAGRCINVFLYSYDTGQLRCASCNGVPPAGYSELGGVPARLERFTYASRAVLDDGTIFFDSPNALASRDINGVGDVYGWRGGQPLLLSSGTGSAPSVFGDVTADGSNVFIKTSQRLVGQDVDDAFDVYDVRVDGGLDQGGGSTAEACGTEGACRPTPTPSSSSAAPSSGTVVGRGNIDGQCLDLRARARKATRKANALARHARKASGARARKLRSRATKEHKQARRAARTANRCGGSGK